MWKFFGFNKFQVLISKLILRISSKKNFLALQSFKSEFFKMKMKKALSETEKNYQGDQNTPNNYIFYRIFKCGPSYQKPA